MKIKTLDPNCFLEGCNTYVTWAERIDCVCQSLMGLAGSDVVQNYGRVNCQHQLGGLGSQALASWRPSSRSRARPARQCCHSPSDSSRKRTQSWSLCCTERPTLLSRNCETVSAMIFSDACCSADRPSVGLFVGKMFFWHQRLVVVVVVLHIWDEVAILKETCRGRTERGSNEAKCEYFPEIEDPLVLYLRNNGQDSWTQFTFHLVNLFQFSKKVTFPRSNFMILKFA